MDANTWRFNLASIFKQFTIGINGLNCSYNGAAYRTTLKELKNLLNKNPDSIQIKNEPVKRFQAIGKAVKFNASFNEVTISYDDASVKARIMKVPIKNQSRELGGLNDCEGVLVFLTYGMSKGLVDNFTLEGIFKISNISSYEKIFQMEMDVMNLANNLNIFNLRGDRFLEIASGFIDSEEYEEEEENTAENDTFTQRSSITTPRRSVISERSIVTSSQQQTTPRMTTNPLKRRNTNDVPPTPFKIPSKIPCKEESHYSARNPYDDDSQNEFRIEVKDSDIIDVIEMEFESSNKPKIPVESIRCFLGIGRVDFSRAMGRLRDRYQLVDNLTMIKRRN
uniref:DUF4773 domain-containing protein n=1 Tax=Strongyloides papillosus TaxID=174720 RepID=A0A0N5CBM9_STREA